MYRTRCEASLQTRLEVIQSQFTFPFTLCRTTETEFVYEEVDVARRLANRIHNACESLRYRLAQPHNAPEYLLDGFLKQLARLEERTLRIKCRLGVPNQHSCGRFVQIAFISEWTEQDCGWDRTRTRAL